MNYYTKIQKLTILSPYIAPDTKCYLKRWMRDKKMKFRMMIFAVLALVASSSYAEELKKLNLDDASVIGTTIQTDTQIKAEGNGSIKITTQWPTTICLGEVTGLNVEAARLVFKAKVRSELSGMAFLELWVQVGSGNYFSRGFNDNVSNKTDWKSIQTLFFLQQGQKADKVTLNLVINGKGTVWIDDIVLLKEPLK